MEYIPTNLTVVEGVLWVRECPGVGASIRQGGNGRQHLAASFKKAFTVLLTLGQDKA